MSSVADFFGNAIKDTYNETVDYWSKDNSIADSVDVLTWSAQNTDVVADATMSGIGESIDELETAVIQDSVKLAALIAVVLYVYHRFIKGGE